MADGPLNDLTVAELQELADAKGVEISKSAKKADIVAALEAAGVSAGEPSADPSSPVAQESRPPVDEDRVEPSADLASPAAIGADVAPTEPSAAPAVGDEPAVAAAETVDAESAVQPEEAVADTEIADPTPVELLTVVVGDASAVLIVNDQQFALSPDNVDQARRLLEQAYYQLH